MKDPDALGDAIREAVTADVNSKLDLAGLAADEKDGVIETRIEKVTHLCGTWFQYQEYLTVEIDTEMFTCVVVPVRK